MLCAGYGPTATNTSGIEATKLAYSRIRSGALENRIHHDLGRFDLVEDCVREPTNECSSRCAVDQSIGLGMALDRCDRCVHGGKEGGGQPRRLPMVPKVGLVKIELSLGGEAKPLHFRRWSLARTSAQDFAADGFRACARRRRASSLRCASVTGTASGVSTRLSQISSSSWSRSAMLSDWISLRTVLMAGFSAPCSLAASPVSTDND